MQLRAKWVYSIIYALTSSSVYAQGISADSLFQKAPLKIEVQEDSSNYVLPPPKQTTPAMEGVFPINRSVPALLPADTTPTFSRPKIETQAINRPPAYSQDYIIRPNRITPSAEKIVNFVLFHTGNKSANTGQLSCLEWERSINMASALEPYGPFHVAITPIPKIETRDEISYLNNSSHMALGPLAAKWDIPIWSASPVDDFRDTLSALYKLSITTPGSLTAVIGWDMNWIVAIEHAWIDGLVKTGDIDQVQAQALKQRIQNWKRSEPNRVDVITFQVNGKKLNKLQWRTINPKIINKSYGCPTS